MDRSDFKFMAWLGMSLVVFIVATGLGLGWAVVGEALLYALAGTAIAVSILGIATGLDRFFDKVYDKFFIKKDKGYEQS